MHSELQRHSLATALVLRAAAGLHARAISGICTCCGVGVCSFRHAGPSSVRTSSAESAPCSAGKLWTSRQRRRRSGGRRRSSSGSSGVPAPGSTTGARPVQESSTGALKSRLAESGGASLATGAPVQRLLPRLAATVPAVAGRLTAKSLTGRVQPPSRATPGARLPGRPAGQVRL